MSVDVIKPKSGDTQKLKEVQTASRESVPSSKTKHFFPSDSPTVPNEGQLSLDAMRQARLRKLSQDATSTIQNSTITLEKVILLPAVTKQPNLETTSKTEPLSTVREAPERTEPPTPKVETPTTEPLPTPKIETPTTEPLPTVREGPERTEALPTVREVPERTEPPTTEVEVPKPTQIPVVEVPPSNSNKEGEKVDVIGTSQKELDRAFHMELAKDYLREVEGFAGDLEKFDFVHGKDSQGNDTLYAHEKQEATALDSGIALEKQDTPKPIELVDLVNALEEKQTKLEQDIKTKAKDLWGKDIKDCRGYGVTVNDHSKFYLAEALEAAYPTLKARLAKMKVGDEITHDGIEIERLSVKDTYEELEQKNNPLEEQLKVALEKKVRRQLENSKIYEHVKDNHIHYGDAPTAKDYKEVKDNRIAIVEELIQQQENNITLYENPKTGHIFASDTQYTVKEHENVEEIARDNPKYGEAVERFLQQERINEGWNKLTGQDDLKGFAACKITLGGETGETKLEIGESAQSIAKQLNISDGIAKSLGIAIENLPEELENLEKNVAHKIHDNHHQEVELKFLDFDHLEPELKEEIARREQQIKNMRIERWGKSFENTHCYDTNNSIRFSRQDWMEKFLNIQEGELGGMRAGGQGREVTNKDGDAQFTVRLLGLRETEQKLEQNTFNIRKNVKGYIKELYGIESRAEKAYIFKYKDYSRLYIDDNPNAANIDPTRTPDEQNSLSCIGLETALKEVKSLLDSQKQTIKETAKQLWKQDLKGDSAAYYRISVKESNREGKLYLYESPEAIAAVYPEVGHMKVGDPPVEYGSDTPGAPTLLIERLSIHDTYQELQQKFSTKEQIAKERIIAKTEQKEREQLQQLLANGKMKIYQASDRAIPTSDAIHLGTPDTAKVHFKLEGSEAMATLATMEVTDKKMQKVVVETEIQKRLEKIIVYQDDHCIYATVNPDKNLDPSCVTALKDVKPDTIEHLETFEKLQTLMKKKHKLKDTPKEIYAYEYDGPHGKGRGIGTTRENAEKSLNSSVQEKQQKSTLASLFPSNKITLDAPDVKALSFEKTFKNLEQLYKKDLHKELCGKGVDLQKVYACRIMTHNKTTFEIAASPKDMVEQLKQKNIPIKEDELMHLQNKETNILTYKDRIKGDILTIGHMPLGKVTIEALEALKNEKIQTRRELYKHYSGHDIQSKDPSGYLVNGELCTADTLQAKNLALSDGDKKKLARMKVGESILMVDKNKKNVTIEYLGELVETEQKLREKQKQVYQDIKDILKDINHKDFGQGEDVNNWKDMCICEVAGMSTSEIRVAQSQADMAGLLNKEGLSISEQALQAMEVGKMKGYQSTNTDKAKSTFIGVTLLALDKAKQKLENMKNDKLRSIKEDQVDMHGGINVSPQDINARNADGTLNGMEDKQRDEEKNITQEIKELIRKDKELHAQLNSENDLYKGKLSDLENIYGAKIDGTLKLDKSRAALEHRFPGKEIQPVGLETVKRELERRVEDKDAFIKLDGFIKKTFVRAVEKALTTNQDNPVHLPEDVEVHFDNKQLLAFKDQRGNLIVTNSIDEAVNYLKQHGTSIKKGKLEELLLGEKTSNGVERIEIGKEVLERLQNGASNIDIPKIHLYQNKDKYYFSFDNDIASSNRFKSENIMRVTRDGGIDIRPFLGKQLDENDNHTADGKPGYGGADAEEYVDNDSNVK